MSALSDAVKAIESLTEAIEGLVAIEERKLGVGTKVLDIAARQEREMEGRKVVELVNPKKPGPA